MDGNERIDRHCERTTPMWRGALLLRNANRKLLPINKLINVGRVKRNIFIDLQVSYELNTGKSAGVFKCAERNPPLYCIKRRVSL